MIRSLVRQYVANYNSDTAIPAAQSIKSCTGYVLNDVARPAEAQELCENARVWLWKRHGLKVSRISCPKLVATRDHRLPQYVKAKLAAAAEQQANDAVSKNYYGGGGESAAEAAALSIGTTLCPAVVRGGASGTAASASLTEILVDRRIRQFDLIRGAERMSRLPYEVACESKWVALAAPAYADPGTCSGVTHAAELRRRERKRMYAYLSSAVRGDTTLLSIWDPLWEQKPLGLPPHSSNPAAMWAGFPEYAQACAEMRSVT